MNKDKNRTAFIRDIIIFLALIILTFFLLLRDQNLSEIFTLLTTVKTEYILIGLLCMICFAVCEGLNIRRCLFVLGDKVGFFKGLKYAVVGFFFSSVTPSSTGGQPMQVYYMHKDDVPASHGTLSLLIEFSSYQTVIVLYAAIGLITQYHLFSEIMSAFKYFIALGFFLNGLALSFVLCCIFSKRLSSGIIKLVYSLLRLLHIKKADKINEKLNVQLEEYQKSAECLKKNKAVFPRIILTTAVQMTAMFSVPYFVYLAFGLSEYSLWAVLSMQAVLYISVSILPLPGAVGASESAFMVLFSLLYSERLLSSAMLQSRFVSFYIPVLVTGLFLCGNYLYSLKKTAVRRGVKDTSRQKKPV